jgi:hypothetical protein
MEGSFQKAVTALHGQLRAAYEILKLAFLARYRHPRRPSQQRRKIHHGLTVNY